MSASLTTSIPSQALAVRFPILSYDDITDLDKAVEASSVQVKVTNLQSTYYTININEAMKNLLQVGDLLRLAYAGSKGFKCNVKVSSIVLNYQTFLKDARLASSTFVKSSLDALSLCTRAIKIADRKLDTSLSIMTRSAEIAKDMAKISELLSTQVESLCTSSKEAFLSASEDEVITTQQKVIVQQRLSDIKAKEASLKARLRELEGAINLEKENEARAAREAEKARDRAFTLAIVNAVMAPVGAAVGAAAGMYLGGTTGVLAQQGAAAAHTVLDQSEGGKKLKENLQASRQQIAQISTELKKLQDSLKVKKEELKQASGEKADKLKQEVEDLEKQSEQISQSQQLKESELQKAMAALHQQAQASLDKESQTATRRAALQKEQRELNGDLAESVSRLTTLTEEKNELLRAIESLGITIKVLGKIKVVFENARIFWQGVEKHCQALTNIKNLQDWADAEFKEEFIADVEKSAFSWLALGRINLVACRAMETVDKRMDAITSDLPTQAESRLLIQTLSAQILAQIKEEDQHLKIEGAKV